MDINKYLEKFDKFTKDPTLDVMKYLLNKFNNPHKDLKIIHVAGTNGKGSICEMLNSVLLNTGYKVGKFISPQLIKFNETICINNIPITDEEIDDILTELSIYIEQYNTTHQIGVKWFEVITTIALIYYAKNNCDFVILETGLGGTTDCTNVVDSLISVIASIDYDHIDILGKNIKEIANHKAGIIKKNKDTIFFYQDDVIDVIKKACIDNNNTLHLIYKNDIKNYSFDVNYQYFTYKNYKNIAINLKGIKQINNACVVLECINVLRCKGYEITDISIKLGLKTVVHKARFEQLLKEPIVIFDGAHNQQAIDNFLENMNMYYKDKKRVYIFSILMTKDYKKVISKLVKDDDSIYYFTDGNDLSRYVSKEELYNEASKYTKNNIHTKQLKDAIDFAIKNYQDRIICIIGSFYIYKDVVFYLKRF